jgi:hypothetical protein
MKNIKLNVLSRESCAVALRSSEELFSIPEFTLENPPRRYVVIEWDEFGTQLEAYQADSLSEIARLLESSTCGADITEILDLDTSEILRPDFERVYHVPRIYRGDIVAYQALSDNN